MLSAWPTAKQLREFDEMPLAWHESRASEFNGTAVSGLEVPTVAGKFGLSASAFGISAVFFPGFEDIEVTERMSKHGLTSQSWGMQRAIEAGLELMAYLMGDVKDLQCPVDLTFLTPFQRDIYGALRTVPYGDTITYGELASLAGHAGKARAVGSAMRYNPIPIYVPCHRVLSATGAPGGWSGPEGWKEWLLSLEQGC